MTDDLSGYARWKSWTESTFAPSSPGTRFFFNRLQSRYGLELGSACEIGFGNGELLRILTECCASVVGIEQLKPLVEAARRSLNVTALEAGPTFWRRSLQPDQFDLIIGLSVLEHFEWETLVELMRWVSVSLKPGGTAVFQFPEGASPLSLGNFNGDSTHKTWLTKDKLRRLILETDLELSAYDLEPLFSNTLSRSLPGRLMLVALDWLRTAYAMVLKATVWPIARNVLFRENTVAVLVKRRV